jgi:hypothetical protein
MDRKIAFISYAHEDREFAEKIASQLSKSGIDVWLDSWEIKAGDSLIQKIFMEGLAKCDVFLILISSSSINSKWVQEELNYAIIKKIEGLTKIIPLVKEKSEIPAPLRVLRWVDLSEDFESGLREVVKSVYDVTDKPPVGKIPDYITELFNSVGGLSREASTIGSILLKGGDTIRGDEKEYSGDELNGLAPKLSIDELNDAVGELEEYGLVRTINFLGTAPYNFGLVEPTYALFLHFRKNGLDYDPMDDIKAIASAINAAHDRQVNGEELQNTTKIDPLRMNRAVAYLEDYGIINVQHFSGTAPFDFGIVEPTWKTRQFVQDKCK